MECNLQELFIIYKGQPIEVITKSGMKYCGILAAVEDESIDIIDSKSRTVHIENSKIEAVIEPRMKLDRLCEDDNCCCENEREHERDDDDDKECCLIN